MQVAGSVNSRYYAQYHSSSSVKKTADTSALEGNYVSNETVGYQRSIETVDYQEYYKAWMSQGSARAIEYATGNADVYSMEQTGAVSIAETEDGGEFLGLTMVPEEGQSVTYGMRAMLSEKSTPDNPIVQVVSNLGGKKVIYNVEVNKVNPNNAREILYDLENPLMPKSQRGENAAKYIEQEKQFYKAFIQKLENITGSSTADTEETADYAKILEEKIREIFTKIQNGDTEASYQIGSQSFTEKEWKEFLDKFDSVEEAIQELMKEEQARKEAEEARKEDVFTNDASTLLTTESTSCVYETADPNDDDIRYITWYTEEGIFCRKAGQTEGYEWSITFENKEQYDKVMEFIGQFPSDWNMRFAAHENFWNDFLNDEIDMEGFMEFINGTNKGVPDYSITVGDSMYIDTDKMQWAKYTNPLGARFYTAEEMHQMQMEIIAANEEKLKAQQVSYEEMYKRTHPDYNGERIFRTISGGQLYTANEIDELLYKEMLERMGTTEEREQQKREEWRKQMGYPGY